MVNLVTIFSDASVSNNIAGGACWFKIAGNTYRYKFPILHTVSSSNEAELIIIAKSINKVFETLTERPLILIIQSDSKHALEFLKTHGARQAKNSDVQLNCIKKNNIFMQNLAKGIMQEVEENNSILYLKHIYSHQGTGTPRNAINEWCDKVAKEARLEAEQNFKKVRG